MKFLKRLKSSNFWVSMISAVVLILQAVFNVEIKTEYLNQIIMAILGLLVMSGIVSDSPSEEVTVKQDINVDGIKENVNNILTQVASSFETNISELVKQFETIGQSLNFSNLFGQKQEVENTVHDQTTESVNIKTEVAPAVKKIEDAVIVENVVTNTETQIVNNIEQSQNVAPIQPIVDEQNTL